VSSVAPKSDPIRHLSDARRRAQLALYSGEHHHLPGGGYLPDATGGLLRGAMVGGSVLAAGLALSLGRTELLSMLAVVVCAHAFAEGLLAARSSSVQLDFYRREIRREAKEIEEDIEGERAELTALYATKGLKGPVLKEAVDQICADPEILLKVMMEEELGIFTSRFEHPALSGLVDACAAVLGAAPAGIAFALFSNSWMVLGVPGAALGIWLLSAGAFGALRVLHTLEPPLEAAAVNVGIALASGGSAWFIGRGLAALLAG
jgi:VIT1/CCC1 family predicted Fe2+/Mn2+ transporter